MTKNELVLDMDLIEVGMALTLEINKLDFVEEENLYSSRLKLEVYFKDENSFGLRGTINFKLSSQCDRCSTKVDSSLDLKVDLFYNLQGSSILDLRDFIREEFWLNRPITNLCSSNCEGLCSSCGAKKGLCSCEDINLKVENPFRILEKIKR